MKNSDDYSLRQIPENFRAENQENEKSVFIDKTKILEFSNSVDEWETNILFGEKGFYSLKGKEAANRIKDYISELESFISGKYSELDLSGSISKEIFLNIKQEKISAITEQMQRHAAKELKEWQLEVFDKAINSCKNRAVLYKNNPAIVDISMKNALTIINLIAQQEHWGNRLLKYNYEKFKSEFYEALISSFITDRDIQACVLFEKYNDLLKEDTKEELEKSIKELKANIIAYNWAKELSSYDMSVEEQEKELKKIKNADIKNAAKAYIKVFSQSKKSSKDKEYQSKNAENWQKISQNLANNTGCSFLDIDFSLKEKSTEKKKEYIRQISSKGYISTKEEDYLKLFEEFSEDIYAFREQDISDYMVCLSNEDYNFFLELQKGKENECIFVCADYLCISELFKKEKITDKSDKYKFLKLFFAAVKNYESANKKTADLSVRNNILNDIKARYM